MMQCRSDSKDVEYFRCFQMLEINKIPSKDRCKVVGYIATVNDVECCVCETQIVINSIMFSHPGERPAYKGCKIYCCRACYNLPRAPKKSGFVSVCSDCHGSIPMGAPIKQNSAGKWVHFAECSKKRKNRKLTSEEMDALAASSAAAGSDETLSFISSNSDSSKRKKGSSADVTAADSQGATDTSQVGEEV
ncbi:hypothetical protein B484DRAFT_409091 [Ochromonadaceae sp. CCMP2298]|nr:hypothetical protein B484DRAFT_409091 [Ochromonadaceae sp. CCMP2298]